MNNLVKQVLAMVAGGLIVIGALHVSGVAAQYEPNQNVDAVVTGDVINVDPTELAAMQASVQPRFQYQGQLLSPTTGEPVADGTYPMTFRLYQELDGAQTSFWGQELSVPVTNGLFSVVLGGVGAPAIPETAFDGRPLFLGVQVGSDPEMTPRQPLLPVPYAMDARFFNGLTTSDFVSANRGPVAYGIVRADGSREKGYRFSSGRTGFTGEYSIEIRDANDNAINYNLNDFVTLVTVIESSECPGGSFATTGSGGGRLIVDIYRDNGSQRDCKFHFITFRP